MANLQEAIELNDNRAVYRSRLLLEDDLAARSASLGRIYHDLGFEQSALVEGWQSVNSDPSNYSAHRFLADSYAALPRFEIAKVSELLQSQLLQPINLAPVQPQLATSNLLILENAGPANPSFNEFSPLFERNRLTAQASAVYGSNNTIGDEIVQSGLWENFSYSLGQFHYETDGFRQNSDLTQDLYDVFVQSNLAPSLSLQGEYRHRALEHGNLELAFVPDPFGLVRRNLRTNTFRVGAKYQPSPDSNIVASVIHEDNEENLDFGFGFPYLTNSHGYNTELQYLLRSTRYRLITGAGQYDVDNTTTYAGDFNTWHSNAYVYLLVPYPPRLSWTFGASVDSLHDGLEGKFKQLNPKFGAIWNADSATVVRLAAFKVLKRTLIADQTIEPTQVAGFNQFFDDFDGTKSTRYGAAVDRKFASNFHGGLELSKRELKVPIQAVTVLTEDWEERLARAYLNWTPRARWAISCSYELEQFHKVTDDPTLSPPPLSMRTEILPVTVRYFHPSGLFGQIGATYVNQKVKLNTGDIASDQFGLLDGGIGYRLPMRRGTISINVRNLLDRRFEFQDLSTRTSPPSVSNPPFLPERTIFASLVLAL